MKLEKKLGSGNLICENCLNLCEILSFLNKKRSLLEILTDAMQEAGYQSCERIYIGTSFCGKYFLGQSTKQLEELFLLCRERKMKVVLVIPVFSEGDLASGKRKIEQIIEAGKDLIDEFTVNDFGMLLYLLKFHISINIGRLFMKDYRDPRYEEYFQMAWKPKMFTDYFTKLIEEYQIHCCEFDLTHQIMDFSEVPNSIIPALHVPYTYQTVGRICEYASINKELSKKFRPNDRCESNCSEQLLKYSVTDGNMEYVRFGRTIYFKHPGYELKGLQSYRMIYFPIDLK